VPAIMSQVCPHCDHPPDDFADEETVVTDKVPTGKLTIPEGQAMRLSRKNVTPLAEHANPSPAIQ